VVRDYVPKSKEKDNYPIIDLGGGKKGEDNDKGTREKPPD